MDSFRDKEYRKAFELARILFLQSDVKERCRIAGAEWKPSNEGGIIYLPYFHTTCHITIPHFKFFLTEKQENINLFNQILILHYLNGVKDIPPANKLISFKEIPSGGFYYPAFARRSIEPLLKTFSPKFPAFKSSAEALGGKSVALGDTGIKISVFPRVPITLVLWFADEEFPPDLQILFDASITEFLSTEDIAVLSQEVMIRMIKTYYSSLLTF
ncbi:MAG TPA: DUF3786 domain-containing protein [Thermodesulfobacteriota bacterium]|nr:DUF3786 domain-containing protein [Thermodesulfobacteriota bacterium]